eukprot:scaffold324536_cov42-Prasinocladus_malaysianus.AAC.1
MGCGRGTRRVKRSTSMVALRQAVLLMTSDWLASRVQQSAARRRAQSTAGMVRGREGGSPGTEGGSSEPSLSPAGRGSSTEVSSTGRRMGACRGFTAAIVRLAEL